MGVFHGCLTGRSPRMKRAERKKLKKKFKVGDNVTWGRKVSYCAVVDVSEDGLFVDASADKINNPRLFVLWCEDLEKKS